MTPIRSITMALTLILAFASGASGGPPFVTDDPEPTDTDHWEIYNIAQGSRALGVTTGQAGFDINYGAYKDLQLTAVLPADFERGATTQIGLGDIEFAAKYLHQSDGGLIPDVAFFPRVLVPTANRQFGSGRLGLFLPLWAQKDLGKWSLFGGGGYSINPGPGERNFWMSGIVLQRAITDRLSLGVEVYHRTPDKIDAEPFTGVNLGVTYKLVEHWSLLAAGGPGVAHAREGGQYDFYFALKADY